MSQAEDRVTTLWERYQQGRRYQDAVGLTTRLPRYVKFLEGDQWPPPTKDTANLPRPVVNVVEMIVRNKVAQVLSTPVRCVYVASDPSADVSLLNDFAAYIDKELGQDALDRQAVRSGAVKGSYIYHYYWDSEGRGLSGNHEGALRCELVDPLRVFVADPAEVDEQKQKWILFATREPVDAVRQKADPGVNPDDIQPDSAVDGRDNPYRQTEQEGTDLVTLLTCYFRQDGEVYCEKATQYCVVNKAFPLTPDLEAARKSLRSQAGRDTADGQRAGGAGGTGGTGQENEDPAGTGTPDEADRPDALSGQVRRAATHLYPVVWGQYEVRDGSIYGRSEVEGVIPNQRAINYLIAMQILNIQDTAWTKYIVHPQALRGQVITNQPGQVLRDYSGTGSGIKRMEPYSTSDKPAALVDAILAMTRTVTGSTEVMTGEALGANMSGAAIAQLQSQAAIPSESLKQAYWTVKEKQGRVKEQFFRTHYTQKSFVAVRQGQGPVDESGMPGELRETKVFDSRMMEQMGPVDVVCEATSGSRASSAGDIQMLETLLKAGLIDVQVMLEAYPRDALGNRTEILRALRQREQSELLQLRAQLEQALAQNQALSEQVQAMGQTVERSEALIQANQQLRQMLIQLYTEAMIKIGQQNSQIQAGNQQIMQTTKDATDFASVIARKAGLMDTEDTEGGDSKAV